jgi:solute carrier family 25 protein 39/40
MAETRLKALTPQQQMLSSGAGALTVSLLMTPLDVVKIRLQTQERFQAKKCFLYSNGLMDHLCPKTNGDPPVRRIHTAQEICDCKWYNRPKYFNSTADAFIKITRTEGLPSLWSGLSPTLALAVPATVIYFTMFEQLRAGLDAVRPGAGGPVPWWVPLTAGGLARLVAVSIVSPLELVRTKMQSQKMPLSQVVQCLRLLVATQGLRGLWNGYTATLLRDVPFSAIYWPLYEQTKASLAPLYPAYGPNSFPVNFASGGVAGSVASTLTLPFDVLKTLKQIDLGERDIMGVKPGRSASNLTIVRELLREQGAGAFFTGLTPRLLKVAPACAIMLSSYEWCKGLFQQEAAGE